MDENFEKKRDTTAEVIAAVENFFTRDNVKYRPFDERNVAKATYSIDTKFRHIDVFFHAYSDKLVLHMILPLSADEEERAKVAEFILRANYGLKVCGSDEFVAPTYEQIDFALVIGMIMVERYGDALVKVMFGVLEPDDAIESVESDD